MKKIIALLITSLLLVSCGSDEDDEKEKLLKSVNNVETTDSSDTESDTKVVKLTDEEIDKVLNEVFTTPEQ